MTDQRQAVVAEALSWERTPWRHRARVKGAGVDCGMLCAEVYERAGAVPHIEPGDYPSDWMQHRTESPMLEWVERYCDRVDGDALPGDIVLFAFGLCVSHAAIVIEWPRIIHAYIKARAVVQDDVVDNAALAQRVAGIWRPRAWGDA
jgi:cell wall-associated NlpC family hydrolase